MQTRKAACANHSAPAQLSECPLHIVMQRLAEAAVRQDVLHVVGEVLPRPGYVAAIEGWLALLHVVQQRVCPATRQVALRPEEVHVTLDALFAAFPTSANSPQLQSQLRCAITSCAAQGQAAGCPWVGAPRERLLE
jgi:hypothetical protein